MRLRQIVLLPLAALTTACAFNHARTPNVTPPAAFEQPGQVPLSAIELDRWWVNFRDPQLDQLIADALARSPDALTAEQRLIEALAVRRSQDLQTLPRGNLAGNASVRDTTDLGGNTSPLFPSGGRTESETLNFNVTWELDLFGRVRGGRQVIRADYAATRFNIEGTRASLVANVADAYFQARGLAIQLQDARETQRIQTELRRIAQVRADRGLGARSDVQRIEGDLAQTRSQIENLQAEIHASQRTLLVLVGRGFEPTASLPIEPVVDAIPPVPEALPGQALARRPDVREAEARLQGAIGRQRLQQLALFPTVNLLPGLGLSRSVSPGVSFDPNTGAITPQTTTSTTGFWSIGLGVTVPVLDIPRLLQDIRAQDARTEQAVIAYERAVQTAFGEADNALVRLGADQRRVAILKSGERSARVASDAALLRYRRGLDDLQTALSAEQAWRSARSALTAQEVQALRRAVQVYKALGGGWTAPAAGGR
jgi:NodT family efflux transporter outer membrane factor (OMF) lipoprotein